MFRGFALELVSEQVLRQPCAGFRVQLELQVLNVLCELELIPTDTMRLSNGSYLMLHDRK